VTGGGAWQHIEINAICGVPSSFCGGLFSSSKSTTQGGWTVGGGVETMFWSHWLARVEYRYSDYGNTGLVFPPAPAVGWNANVNFKTNTVLGGLAYKF